MRKVAIQRNEGSLVVRLVLDEARLVSKEEQIFRESANFELPLITYTYVLTGTLTP